MKRFITVAAMGVFLAAAVPGSIWAEAGGAAGGATGGTHGSDSNVSEPSGGKGVLQKGMDAIKGDTFKNKLDKATEPFKSDIPKPDMLGH